MPITLIKKKNKTTYIQTGMKGKEMAKVFPLICDRLTLTCDFPKKEHSKIQFLFKQLNAKPKHLYDQSIFIPNLSKAFAPYVEQIEDAETYAYMQCSPNIPDIPFFRIQFNPSKLANLNELRAIVNTAALTNPKYDFDFVLNNGNITQVDFAIDIADETVDSFLFSCPQIQCADVIQGKSGRTEYLGANKGGNKRLRIYDKVPALKEHNKTHWKQSEQEPIPKYDVLRIEISLKPKCKLNQFLKLHKNPFEKLTVAAYSSVKLPEDFNALEKSLWNMFLSLARFEGAHNALSRLPKIQKAKFRNQLKKGTAHWWNPEYIWNQSSDIVSQLFGKT